MSSAIAISLADLEAKIERGLATFVEVGSALTEIRDRALYQDDYGDFESYLVTRWGFKRAHAYRLMEAAGVVRELSPMGDTPLPINERQAREIARIPQEQRAEVWQRVTEQHGERVTAQDIRRAVHSEESPPYDPPLLSVVDLETGEVVSPGSSLIGIPDVRQISDEERAFDRLITMSTITQMDPIATAEAALRYRGGSVQAYVSRAPTVIAWHQQFIAALEERLSSPLRRVK